MICDVIKLCYVILETPKQVLWQTMKYHRLLDIVLMLHGLLIFCVYTSRSHELGRVRDYGILLFRLTSFQQGLHCLLRYK